MKIIKKFWGVALVVILLSTMFVGTAAPVSAANYAFSPDTTQPSGGAGGNGLLNWAPGTNMIDVAQSGTTIYATTNTGFLYKSVDGGATWFRANIALVGTPGIVAVAPDNANIVAYVDTVGMVAYLSNDGGATFGAMTGSATTTINALAISPLAPNHLVAIGGNIGAAASIEYWRIGLVAPSWTAIPVGVAPNVKVGINSTKALTFSTNFAADACLVVAGIDDTSAARGLFVDVYSFNLNLWNPAGYGFPRTVVATGGGVTVSPRVQIVLDQNFYLGDVTTQIGFIAADITNAGVQAGGVFRMDMTKIYAAGVAGVTANNIIPNSVAWDGTNLMVAGLTAGPAPAPYLTVLRSANALAAGGWVFIPNSPLGTPSTGTLPLVIFNGGAGYAFSSGPNNAVAKTTDLGKTFVGTALVNSNFNLITDYWISPDGAVTYVLVDDGVSVNLWKKAGATWTRIAIVAAAGATWMVRADKDAPATVFLGLQGAPNFQKSVDGGVNWIMRAASANIQDFVVQDANTVFVATMAGPGVVKSINGAFTWTPTFPVIAGAPHSLTLIADNQLVLGSTLGSVAYTSDVVTWTTLPVLGVPGTPIIATASGTATGDVIWAGGTGGALGMWTIGTSFVWSTYGQAGVDTIVSVNGIAYANGILYVLDNVAGFGAPPNVPSVYRFLYPTNSIFDYTDKTATGLDLVAGTTINALQTTGSTNLVARSDAATDTMMSYTDLVIGAWVVPVPTYPINGAIIGVNSIGGWVNDFNFMWTAPYAGSFGGYRFELEVFLDELGIVPASVRMVTNPIGTPAVFDGGTGSFLSSTLGAAFNPVAGETYYWRVRVAAGFPVESYWSAMQSFTVQQLQAVVPEIGSPQNGSVIQPSAAAFSWTPIAGATSYLFQLDTGATFTAPLYSATVTSAGASLPANVTLERGRTYFWRVKTLTPSEGEWSTVGNFMVAEEVITTTPTASTTTVTPITTTQTIITIPASTSTVITMPGVTTTTQTVNPTYIWAIIIIGAVLVLAVIVLIVRTRRSV